VEHLTNWEHGTIDTPVNKEGVMSQKIRVGLLSAGSHFTTSLTGRHGRVLAAGEGDNGVPVAFGDGTAGCLHPSVVVIETLEER
jgi:hypothetical protein